MGRAIVNFIPQSCGVKQEGSVAMEKIRWSQGMMVVGCGVLLGLLTSCSTAKVASSSSDSGGGETLSGTSSISGEVDVSSDDLAKISGGTSSSLSMSSKAHSVHISSSGGFHIKDISVLSHGTAFLYQLNTAGKPVFVATSNVREDGTYTFAGIADGKKYIVEIEAVGSDVNGVSNTLKMSTFVDVARGATLATNNVTEKESLIAHFILTQVASVAGSTFRSEIGRQLHEKALEVINEGLGDNTIQRVSPVSRTPSIQSRDDSSPSLSDPGVTDLTNINTMANSDELKSCVDQATLDARMNLPTMTLEAAKAVIRSIFAVSQSSASSSGGGGDNGPPDFYIEQFAQGFVSGRTIDIAGFSTALHDSIPNPQIKAFLTVDRIEQLLLSAANDDGKMVKTLYTYYADTSGNLNSSIVPTAAIAVFPDNAKWTLPVTVHQVMNVPQAIMLLKVSGLIDLSVEGATDEMRQSLQHGGPYFNPMQFLDAIHFVSLDNGRNYILESRIVPVKMYKQGDDNNGGVVDALDCQVTTFKNGTGGSDATSVVLEYPRAHDTHTVALMLDSGDHGQSQSASVKTSTAAKVMQLVSNSISNVMYGKTYNDTIKVKTVHIRSGSEEMVQYVLSPYRGNTPTYLSDFVSGTASVKIMAGDTVLAQKDVYIFSFPNVGPVNMTYPRGMDLVAAQANNGWDPNFDPQELEMDSVSQTASPCLRWDAVDAIAPEGYQFAYAVQVGKSETKVVWDRPMAPDGSEDWDQDNSQYGWRYKQIWSSWNENQLIFGTSYQLKQKLPRTISNGQGNYKQTYTVDVTPLLVHKLTGQIVWQGTNSRTDFKVGAGAPWNISLHGHVTFSANMRAAIANAVNSPSSFNHNILGNWYVGLFKTGYMDRGSNPPQWVNSLYSTGAHAPAATGNEFARLGTSQEVAAASSGIDYTLPSISKTDGVFERFAHYQVVLWCDRDDKTAGSVDFSFTDYQGNEYMESAPGDLTMDQQGVWLNTYTVQGGSSFKMVSDEGGATIDLSVGERWQP